MSQTGLAVFVKTPHLTPPKTRLAKTIGDRDTHDFYLHCIRCAEDLAKIAQDKFKIKAYWAVAEAEGVSDPLWKHLAVILQGTGVLSLRLHRVYGDLIVLHEKVLLIDSARGIVDPGRFLR